VVSVGDDGDPRGGKAERRRESGAAQAEEDRP